MSDVTAVIIFHAEGLLAQASILSYAMCCDAAAAQGIHVTRIAVLDKPDDMTARCVQAASGHFDRVEVVGFGDLGATRNHCLALSSTRYAVFFDGDDLWGEEWIFRAHRAAESLEGDDVILHPRVIAVFSADDYALRSGGQVPGSQVESHFIIQTDSRDPLFDPRTLLMNNPWSANAFAPRTVFARHPYRAVDREHGFGIEDWTWNLETLAAGIAHVVVPDTVHCIRAKPLGSLAHQNRAEGLLPPVHEYVAKLG